MKEQPEGFRVHAQPVRACSQLVIQREGYRKAPLSKFNCRRQYLFQGHGAVLFQSQDQAGHGSRYTCGLIAEKLAHSVYFTGIVEKHGGAGRGGCGFAVVDQGLGIGFCQVN